MNDHPRYTRFFLIALLLSLTGCVSQPVQQETTDQPDVNTIQKQAASSYENSDWRESEKYYLILVENDPENALNWHRLGNIYARTNRPDAAIIAYREALARDNKLANAWYNLGIIQLRQAAHSFNEMQIHIDSTMPLAESGQNLLEGILELIQDGNIKEPATDEIGPAS
ncbi:MAG: tetratricopeptide repeat protein [Gammaproteobacteria bacterium]